MKGKEVSLKERSKWINKRSKLTVNPKLTGKWIQCRMNWCSFMTLTELVTVSSDLSWALLLNEVCAPHFVPFKMSSFGASVECGATSMLGRLEISKFCKTDEMDRRENWGGEVEAVIKKGRWWSSFAFTAMTNKLTTGGTGGFTGHSLLKIELMRGLFAWEHISAGFMIVALPALYSHPLLSLEACKKTKSEV